jgi:hypothetical protein
MSVASEQRFSRRRPCPICGGSEDLPRGKGKRCAGYLSSDASFAYCTREEEAGALPLEQTDPPSFCHSLEGECGCGREHGPARTSARIVATYDYTDADGQTLFQVVRFEPKSFRQRRPDGKGGWIWNLQGVERVLFRLPQVLAAVERGEPVFIPEGEQDVLAIEAACGVATCNPMGAGKWRSEYAEALRGAEVVIVADRDKEGRRHAAAVADSLAGIAASVAIVEAAVGKDAADHLAAGHALDDFRPLEPALTTAATPFSGRTHAEVLEMRFDDGAEPLELIEDLVPCGVLMTVAGLPESYKGWLCSKIATCVAAGEGVVLGRQTLVQGPVGYWWQDDSLRNEVERVQLFARVQETASELPLRWFLNEGLELPRDLERLRATIEEHRLVLAIIDSWYNVASALDLKDREPGAVFARLKAEVCDPTGCTVSVVDHMPWASDQPRKRLRGYGDVFKNAVVRAGIYIDVEGKKVHVEVRGNNMKGIRRTPAYWDPECLELKLVEPGSHDDQQAKVEQRAEKVLTWLVDHPRWHSTSTVRKAVGGRESVTDAALELLKSRAEVQDSGRDGGPWSGRAGDPRYWIATVHAQSEPPETSAQLVGPWVADVSSGGRDEPPRPPRPAPHRGAEVGRAEVQDSVEQDEIERIRRKHSDIAEGRA